MARIALGSLLMLLALGTTVSAQESEITTYVNAATGEIIEVTSMTLDTVDEAELVAELWIQGSVVEVSDDIRFADDERLSDEIAEKMNADSITIIDVASPDYALIGIGVVMQRGDTVHLMIHQGDDLDKVSAVTFMIDFMQDGADVEPPEGFEVQQP